MTRGWTPEKRAAQAERTRKQKPWRKSTGPKSVPGQAVSKMNALKHGGRSAAAIARHRADIAFLRHHAALLKQVQAMLRHQLLLKKMKNPTNELGSGIHLFNQKVSLVSTARPRAQDHRSQGFLITDGNTDAPAIPRINNRTGRTFFRRPDARLVIAQCRSTQEIMEPFRRWRGELFGHDHTRFLFFCRKRFTHAGRNTSIFSNAHPFSRPRRWRNHAGSYRAG